MTGRRLQERVEVLEGNLCAGALSTLCLMNGASVGGQVAQKGGLLDVPIGGFRNLGGANLVSLLQGNPTAWGLY